MYSVQNAGVVVMTDGFLHEAEHMCKSATYPLYLAFSTVKSMSEDPCEFASMQLYAYLAAFKPY